MWYNCDIDDSVFWTPAEWSWIGTMAGMVFPAMHYGRPIVGYPIGQFDPESAFSIMEEFGVTDAFLAPTALRMMQDVEKPSENYDLDVDTIASGGEVVTSDIHRWAESKLSGTTINEAYGRTEGTMLVCNSQAWFDTKPGSMGQSVIGHEVAIVDSETGEKKSPGEVGEIAVKRDNDPALFEEYWQAPEKTADSRINGWDLTGDLARRDEDGYFYYVSRKDDVIITSGYRVGPSEVEDAILEHEAVAQVGVIGVPDDKRGEIIKAYVKLTEEAAGDDGMKGEIQDMVKSSLAKHEYPREIEFVGELPKTTTGKIQRTKLRDRHEES
jgi:acetyl-CoA synthetase